jgi:hypothetical protein
MQSPHGESIQDPTLQDKSRPRRKIEKQTGTMGLSFCFRNIRLHPGVLLFVFL